ncbi:hypothetical protein BKA59DRAFT_11959 [Fusarium tricinctum]|uniref:F-box domain-containing protein n=3 Tax=Fusarium tricinctum species complex TaxID=679429 RepID=A0A8K0S7B9_9HYPO|nr:hypothetical protein BKA59DRAFT_11959 [Fusarium tricinctum]CEG03170.1 unnamed protein product [Fusarium acuminatum CS5907]
MDTLPTEILIQILDSIPSSASKQARLTSRAFNAILSKRTFEVLISFLNPEFAQNTVLAIARDPQLRLRRSSIWSPRCSVPQKLPVDESFLMALWVGLHGTSWAAERAAHGEKLDVCMWQNTVGRDISEDQLRETLFRYALYLSYVNECGEEQDVAQAWLSNALCGKARH